MCKSCVMHNDFIKLYLLNYLEYFFKQIFREKGENPVIQVRVELLEDPGIKVTLVQMEKLEPLVIQEEKENMVRQDPMVCMACLVKEEILERLEAKDLK